MGFLIRREGMKHIIIISIVINLNKNKRKQVKIINTIMVIIPYVMKHKLKTQANTRTTHVIEYKTIKKGERALGLNQRPLEEAESQTSGLKLRPR